MDPKIEESKRLLKIADHMIYVTYPVIKESKILIKILDEIGTAISNIIDSILQNECRKKMIRISSDPKANFESFIKISKDYGIPSQMIGEIDSILSLVERHKKSPMEFSRKDKVIIMQETLRTESVNVNDLKRYMGTAKELLRIVDSAPKN